MTGILKSRNVEDLAVFALTQMSWKMHGDGDKISVGSTQVMGCSNEELVEIAVFLNGANQLLQDSYSNDYGFFALLTQQRRNYNSELEIHFYVEGNELCSVVKGTSNPIQDVPVGHLLSAIKNYPGLVQKGNCLLKALTKVFDVAADNDNPQVNIQGMPGKHVLAIMANDNDKLLGIINEGPLL